MMIEFADCLRINCYVSATLLKKKYVTLWPQSVKRESPDQGWHEWQFYIEWTPGKGTHVQRLVCDLHHDQILAIAQDESQYDLLEQEATDRWLIQVSSQALRPC